MSIILIAVCKPTLMTPHRLVALMYSAQELSHVQRMGLADMMTVAQKRWVYSSIDGLTETPKHICPQEGDAPTRIVDVEFDIDSITRFPSGLSIAKGGIRWNAMQMPVSNLRSSLHLSL
jgi:hypothetical protein